MSTNKKLIREWKRIKARAEELHSLTDLAMYKRIIARANRALRELRVGKGEIGGEQ